jgi:hypothetical protein
MPTVAKLVTKTMNIGFCCKKLKYIIKPSRAGLYSLPAEGNYTLKMIN